MKKFATLIFFLILIFSFTVIAGSDAEVSLSSPEKIDKGEYFDVKVNASDVPEPGLNAFEFIINFDPDILEAISVEEGSIFSNYPSTAFIEEIDNKNGQVHFAVTRLGGDSASIFNGRLAVINFKGIKDGQSQLSFIKPDKLEEEIVLLVDENVDYVATNVDSTSVVVGESDPLTMFTLNMEVEGEGTVEPSEGSHIYEEGTVVNLNATPSSGWEFNKWEGNVEDSSSSSTTIEMKADETVKVWFEEEEKEEDPGESSPGGGGGAEREREPEDPLPPAPLPFVSKEINPNEDTLLGFDEDRITVKIPSSSLDKPGILSIRTVEEAEKPNIPRDMKALTSMYEITVEVNGEEVRKFNKPITIKLKYDYNYIQGLTEEQVMTFYWDNDLEKWIAFPTYSAGNWHEVQTEHLTKVKLFHHTEFPIMNDIMNHWARSYVIGMASMEIIQGYPDETFRPDAGVTRAEFAKIITEAIDIDIETNQSNSFNDEIPNWAEPFINAAVKEGLFTGYPDGTFGPSRNITREEIASVLIRASAKEYEGKNTYNFIDTSSIAEWARPGVSAVVDLGIVTGYPDNTFRPKQLVTRAEACTMMWRVIYYLNK